MSKQEYFNQFNTDLTIFTDAEWQALENLQKQIHVLHAQALKRKYPQLKDYNPEWENPNPKDLAPIL